VQTAPVGFHFSTTAPPITTRRLAAAPSNTDPAFLHAAGVASLFTRSSACHNDPPAAQSPRRRRAGADGFDPLQPWRRRKSFQSNHPSFFLEPTRVVLTTTICRSFFFSFFYGPREVYDAVFFLRGYPAPVVSPRALTVFSNAPQDPFLPFDDMIPFKQVTCFLALFSFLSPPSSLRPHQQPRTFRPLGAKQDQAFCILLKNTLVGHLPDECRGEPAYVWFVPTRLHHLASRISENTANTAVPSPAIFTTAGRFVRV